MKLSRRGFVKFSAGSAMGLGLSGLSLKALADLTAAATEEVYPPRGPETLANSICQLCPGGCGMTVRKIGERVVGVRGNKTSPVNRGGLCPIGVASLQYLYHPRRLMSPVKKEGNSWKTISWEQALEEIAARLRALVEQGRSNRMVVLSHPLPAVFREIVLHLLQGLGSRNLIELSGWGDGTEVAIRLMQGSGEGPAFDLERCNYILSVGCEILEGWMSPVWAMRNFAQFRGKRPRGRLTYAGTRQSVTASKADQWIRLRPGSEGVFALGIAYVLISERLYDFEFVSSHCFGFEDWVDAGGNVQKGFRNLVLERYPLHRVSELTGAPAERILGVAREFGDTRPALALAGSIHSVTANSVHNALCVHSLNALAGSIDRTGGVLAQYPGALDSIPERGDHEVPDLIARRSLLRFGEDPLEALERALELQQPYLPSALLLLETDPVFDARHGESLARHLKQIPLIVSVSSFMNASAQLADYVLPAASFLESWVEQAAPPGVPFSYEGLALPIMQPWAESRPCADIVLALTRALNISTAGEDYGWRVKNRLARLYELRRGAVAGTVFDQLWHQLMEQSGWWAPTYEDPEQLLEQMADKGGWWDSFYRTEDWQRTLPAASGKFSFYLPEVEVLREAASVKGAEFYLPHFEPLPEVPVQEPYPFRASFFDPLAAKSRLPFLPFVHQVAGGHVQNAAGLWVEISPEDASHLGVRSGDLVRVESRQGGMEAFVRISPAQPSGVVSLPRGLAGMETSSLWRVPSHPGAAALVDFQSRDGSGAGEVETWVRIVPS